MKTSHLLPAIYIEHDSDKVVAWVEVAPGTRVRTALPADAFQDIVVHNGREFIWDMNANVARPLLETNEQRAERDRMRVEAETLQREYYKIVHKHCGKNRNEIQHSKTCGCFYCCTNFPAPAVCEWVDPNEDTAICPECGIDSVLGDASDFPITDGAFLAEMHRRYFT